MTPPDAIGQLAPIHHHLGNIYHAAGDLARSLRHCHESIRLKEAGGDLYGAAQTRYNVARVLAQGNRFSDARQYAEAALRAFQTYGPSAAEDVRRTLDLISRIARDSTP